MNEAAGEARKRTAWAHSSGLASRPSGCSTRGAGGPRRDRAARRRTHAASACPRGLGRARSRGCPPAPSRAPAPARAGRPRPWWPRTRASHAGPTRPLFEAITDERPARLGEGAVRRLGEVDERLHVHRDQVLELRPRVVSSMLLASVTPALPTTASSRPKCSSAAATARRLVQRVGHVAGEGDRAGRGWLRCGAPPSRRPSPPAANACAQASPIPLVAPVTSATRRTARRPARAPAPRSPPRHRRPACAGRARRPRSGAARRGRRRGGARCGRPGVA